MQDFKFSDIIYLYARVEAPDIFWNLAHEDGIFQWEAFSDEAIQSSLARSIPRLCADQFHKNERMRV